MSSGDGARREGGRRTQDGHDLSTNERPDRSGRPLFSVVTVVYNTADYIEQTIQSVLSQSYPDVEYIIVDGGSTDGSLDIIEKYDDQIDYWVSEADQGIYDAMNKGIQLCTGELIKLLNADDLLTNRAISDYVDAYERETGSDVILNSYTEIISLEGKVLELWTDRQLGKFYPCTLHASWVVPAELYRKFGPYSTRYDISSDYEYYWRVVDSVKVVTIKRPLLQFRVGGVSGGNLKGQHEVLAINMKYQGLWKALYVYSHSISTRVNSRLRRWTSKLLRLGAPQPGGAGK